MTPPAAVFLWPQGGTVSLQQIILLLAQVTLAGERQMFGVYTPNTPMCHSSGSERRALRFQTPAWLSAHSLPLTRQVLALMKVFFFSSMFLSLFLF